MVRKEKEKGVENTKAINIEFFFLKKNIVCKSNLQTSTFMQKKKKYLKE